MMRERKLRVRIAGVVAAEGSISVDPGALRRIGLQKGTKIDLEVVVGAVPKALQRRGVTEAEIDRIASVQVEERENVLDFLESEGSLAGSKSFARRVSVWLR